MFRRRKPESTDSTQPVSLSKSGGKGRPTPTRREAEAAAKARAKKPTSRRDLAAARAGQGQRTRAALRGQGDERDLPARDRGPVKAFVRDVVDSRFSFVNLLIPAMVIVLVLGYTGNRTLVAAGNALLLGLLLLVVVELVLLRTRIRRELKTRFPDASTKGTTYYAIVRAMQMRFMRLPKPRVKVGQQLPEVYR